MADELAPRHVVASLNAAVVLYLLAAILTLSIAALIYAGPLAGQLPRALGGVLIGAAALVAMVSLFGSYGGAIAPAEDTTGVIVALGAAAAAAALPAGVAAESLAATIAVLVAGSTLAMGLVYLLLGALRLGALVRYMPYPVMGGFLAGTGWLLVVGGIGVTTAVPLGPGLLEPATALRWLPAFVLGVVMLLTVRRWGNPALLAALCALAMALFYAVAWRLGAAPAELAAAGWLLGPFADGLGWHFALAPATLRSVDWSALATVLPVVAPAALIGAIALLLNTSALELSVRRDIALDRELIAHGAGNLASGLAGGLIGYTAISVSVLGHTLARGRRLPGLLVALMLLATALLGTSLVAAIPRLVMAGLLIFIGLALLFEWVVAARRALPLGDYAVVLAIFATIAVQNFLSGVALGLLLTTVLFVVSYSRVDVVRFELSGDALRSRVQRGARERERLRAESGRLLAFRLHGFIFFGTAHGLRDRVRRGLSPSTRKRYVVLDFEQVSGLDSTALASFGKLAQGAAEHGVELVLCGLHGRVDRQMRHGELAALPRCADLDHAVEWCEQRLLDEAASPSAAGEPPAGALREQLLAVLPDAARIDALLARMGRRSLAAGEHLVREGDAADALFIIESGQLTAQLSRGGGGRALRLQTMQPGSIVGELGFMLDARRSADVVADRDSVVRVIEREPWRRLVEQEPELAQTLDALVIRLLGERVMHLTNVVDALQR